MWCMCQHVCLQVCMRWTRGVCEAEGGDWILCVHDPSLKYREAVSQRSYIKYMTLLLLYLDFRWVLDSPIVTESLVPNSPSFMDMGHLPAWVLLFMPLLKPRSVFSCSIFSLKNPLKLSLEWVLAERWEQWRWRVLILPGKGEGLVSVCCFWYFVCVLLESEWQIGVCWSASSDPMEVAARRTVVKILKPWPGCVGERRLISHVCQGHGGDPRKYLLSSTAPAWKKCFLWVIFHYFGAWICLKILTILKKQRGKSDLSLSHNPK